MTNVARRVKCAKCYKMNARRCKIQSGQVNINKFNRISTNEMVKGRNQEVRIRPLSYC